ncbi:MAG: hypothetical protein EOM68_00015 [Spirochaetia bacterium]|nr:hypothetical protein [Spirochaetia bacterium]
MIHEVERFDRCYVVVLDKYTEFRTYGDDEAPEALQYMFNRAQYIVETGNSTDWSGTSDYSVGAATLEIAEAREAYAERLFDSALKIHQFFKGIAEFDCHSGNVMINAAGELVITDPVSFTQGIKAWDAIDPAYCGDMREQMFIQRCKERHEGKLNKAARRKEARKEYKEKRRGRKARQFKIKQRDAWMHHEQERAMNMREVGLIGLRTWMDKGWLTLRGIARKHGDANHFAIANAINLPIDDLLQAQFLG